MYTLDLLDVRSWNVTVVVAVVVGGIEVATTEPPLPFLFTPSRTEKEKVYTIILPPLHSKPNSTKKKFIYREKVGIIMTIEKKRETLSALRVRLACDKEGKMHRQSPYSMGERTPCKCIDCTAVPLPFQKGHPIPSYPYKSRVKGRGLILSPESGRDVVGGGGRKRKVERIRESVRLSFRPEYADDAGG